MKDSKTFKNSLLIFAWLCCTTLSAQTQDDWARITSALPKAEASNTYDYFGYSVDMGDDYYAAIGAYYDSRYANRAGAAYVVNTSYSMATATRVDPEDPKASNAFGKSVAIYNNWLVVGAPGDDDGGNSAGAIYIFKRVAGSWRQHQKIAGTSAGGRLGESIDIDGDFIVVGSPNYNSDHGRATFYEYNSSTDSWSVDKNFASSYSNVPDRFGCAVAIHGNYAVIGAFDDDKDVPNTPEGAAYIYYFNGSSWSYSVRLKASDGAKDDHFGDAVAIYNQTVVVGALYNDHTKSNAGAAYVFNTSGTQLHKYTASDASTSDYFGSSVAINSNTILIGASGFDGPSINGTGKVYSYYYLPYSNNHHFTYETSTSNGSASFGNSVALSKNNLALIMGGYRADRSSDKPMAGIAISRRRSSSNGSWVNGLTFYPGSYYTVVEDFRHGYAVAMDGDLAVVGTYYHDHDGNYLNSSGAAHVYSKHTNGTWIHRTILTASDREASDYFGQSVAISGNTILVGCPRKSSNDGAVYVYEGSGSSWSQTQKLTPSVADSEFGDAVAIHGDQLVVGAYKHTGSLTYEGAAYIYERSGGSWSQTATLNSPNAVTSGYFGNSVAIDANTVAIGAEQHAVNGTRNGAIYVYTKSASTWGLSATLTHNATSTSEYLGTSVSIDGDWIAAGARSGYNTSNTRSGAVFVYQKPQTGWADATETAKMYPSDGNASDYFGQSVSITGDQLIVGAYGHDLTGSNQGAAYIFERPTGGWVTASETKKITHETPEDSDYFGYAVAGDGATVLVGAYLDDNNDLSNTGSVFFYERDINYAPVFTKGADQQLRQWDTTAQTIQNWATGIADGDDGSQTLHFEVTTDREELFTTLPSLSTNGTLNYTIAGDTGTATVSIVLKDNGGTLFGGVDSSAVATFEIEVQPYFEVLTQIDADEGHSHDYLIGDINGNGRHDAIVFTQTGNTTGNTKIYLRNNDQTYSPLISPLVTLRPVSWSWIDLNSDGALDLFICEADEQANYSSAVHINRGDGVFEEKYDLNLDIYIGNPLAGDFDNDGDQDLALYGGNTIGYILFENSSGNLVEHSVLENSTSLFLSLAVSDFNKNGAIDFITGTRFYINKQGLTFEIQHSGFADAPSPDQPLVADWNADGYADILYSGHSKTIGSSTQPDKFLKLFKGTSTAEFIDVTPSNLPALTLKASNHGDINNDGYADILFHGYDFDSQYLPGIYLNEGDFQFSDKYMSIFDIGTEVIDDPYLHDIDNDNDLDILFFQGGKLKSFVNTTTPNTAPALPSNLLATITTPGEVAFSWTSATDVETPDAALTYDLVIAKGTFAAPDTIIKITPADLTTGFRRLAKPGDIRTTSWTLRGILPEGDYEWGVQAIDAGFVGGAFAKGNFSVSAAKAITSYSIPGAKNPEAVIDTAHHSIHVEMPLNADLSALTASFTLSAKATAAVAEVAQESGVTPNNFIDTVTYTVTAENGSTQDWKIILSYPPFSKVEKGLMAVHSGSASWADYNGDGYMDLLLSGTDASSSPQTSLYTNDGSGIFTESSTSFSSLGVAESHSSWADYDHDGDLDLLLTGTSNASQAKLLKNNGGTFELQTTAIESVRNGTSAWADFDLDGDLDVVVAGLSSFGIKTTLYQNDAGTFAAVQAGLTPVYNGDLAWGDYDLDGDPDLLLTGTTTGEEPASTLFTNNGDGTFTEVNAGLAALAESAAAFVDFDNDGDLDIALSGNVEVSINATRIYLNDAGTFTESTMELMELNEGSMAWADLNHDGYPDLTLTGTDDNNQGFSLLYYNQKDESLRKAHFTDFEGLKKSSVTIADADGDADLDVVISGLGKDPATHYFENNDTLSNTAPQAPETLLVNSEEDGMLKLSWSMGTDAETASAGLSYDYYVKKDGQLLISAPANTDSGVRMLTTAGAQKHTSVNIHLTLDSLSVYEVGVQTIDAGMAGSAFKTYTFTYGAPSATIELSDTQLISGESTTLTITFTEEVKGFDLSGISGADGVVGDLQTNDNITFTASFVPTANQETTQNTLIIDLTQLTDLEDNPGVGTSTSPEFSIDTKAPELSVTISDLLINGTETAEVTFSFTEEVRGFGIEQVTATGGTLSDVTSADEGMTYTSTYTPASDLDKDSLFIAVNFDVSDVAGNLATGLVHSDTFRVDSQGPTVSIAVAKNLLLIDDSTLVTITFSEAVSGFDKSDITFSKGELLDMTTQDSIVFETIFVPARETASAENQISITSQGYTDVAGNIGSVIALSNTFEINTVTPTITFDELVTKTYGDAAFDLEASASSGLEVTFQSLNTDVATIEGKTVTILAAGTAEILATQDGDTQNNPAQSVSRILTVNKATLNVSVRDTTREYGESNPVYTLEYAGFQNGEDQQSLAAIPTASSDALPASPVGSYDINLSGGSADNYELNLTGATLTITKAPLTITAVNRSLAYGVENPELFLEATGFKNEDTGDDITLPTISTTATVTSDVGIYPIALTGGAATNYEIELIPGELEIIQRTAVISIGDAQRIYGEENPEFSFQFSLFVNGDDSTVLITQPELTTTATTSSDVGTYPITASGATAKNYQFEYQSGTLTIEKATQSIVLEPIDGKDVSDAPFTVTASATSGLEVTLDVSGPATVSGHTLTLTGETGYVTVTATQAGNGNYYASDAVSTGFEVTDKTKSDQTISIVSIANQIYGAGPIVIDASSDSDLDVSLEVSGPAILSDDTLKITGVGLVEVIGIQQGNEQYNPASATISFTVSQATLEVTVENHTITYGDALPTLTYEISGYIYGESESNLLELPEISTEATASSDAGSYVITTAGGKADNYLFETVDGTLTIEKADQTISLAPIADQTTDQSEITISGSASSGLELQYSVEGPATVSGSTLTLDGNTGIVVLTAAQPGNVNFNAAASVSVSFMVTSKDKTDQSITFDSIADQPYGHVYSLVATASSGLPVSFELIDGPATLSGNDLTMLDIGLVTVKASQAGDATHNPAVSVTRSFNVSPAKLKVIANDLTKVYGTPNPELTWMYEGFVFDDSEAILDQLPTASTDATTTSDAGTYAISLSGGQDSHYTFEYLSGKLTITKAPATITLSDLEHMADGTEKLPVAVTSPEGLAVTFTFEGLEGAPVLSGSYPFTATIADKNYEGSADGTLVIAEVLEAVIAAGLQAYPNPTLDYLNFSNHLPEAQVRVVSLDGRMVLEQPFTDRLDVRQLPEGHYVLIIQTDEKQVSLRFVKQ
ncbi:MBG domain-containing protein [Marinoscillum furvescens]|uniref:Putative secreted protein (Por secretion system target) n=1 Tax=Marinoscillum furvescens DSM 4134 TaxID=1122208 RepID=A0A3D9L890_MARFU|nr:MBG domain-containing protein [Marinoscillum furvescens]REE01506.1 putative secreted protein (Por secretion system target) [Marinoscillum furvescens DSM 4134]